MIDELTKLGTSKYLEREYFNYIKQYKNANYIMIDFTNFKMINDTYGHDEGDKCLKSFASKIKTFFQNSILIRLHGDEFAIVTFQDEDSIEKLLNLINLSIKNESEAGNIPIEYTFNAGSVNAEKNLKEVQAKADYMMYYAKKRGIIYQDYKEEIYEKKKEEEIFLEHFQNILDCENFSYYGRNLYNKCGKKTNYIQIYTKDCNGNNIFDGGTYSILRDHVQISQFDMFNIQNLIGQLSILENSNNKYFINLDYKSLLSVNSLIDFFLQIKDKSKNSINNVILSIDISDIQTTEYKIVIDMIRVLKSIGFEIRLDKVDNKIADYLIEEIQPSFIKISTSTWKESLNDKKRLELLKLRLKTYLLMENKGSLIFEQIEKEKEKNAIEQISKDYNTLYSGNCYSKEKRLKLFKNISR